MIRKLTLRAPTDKTLSSVNCSLSRTKHYRQLKIEVCETSFRQLDAKLLAVDSYVSAEFFPRVWKSLV